MAPKPLPHWRRSLAAPKAHRTQRRMKNGDWFMRITAGRHASIALCHSCQRAAFYAGSFLELVRRSLAKFGTGSYYARAATTPTPENVSG